MAQVSLTFLDFFFFFFPVILSFSSQNYFIAAIWAVKLIKRVFGAASHDYLKDTIERNLYLLFQAPKAHPKPTLNDDDIRTLQLRVENLDTNSTAPSPEPSFFKPMSLSELQNYSVIGNEQDILLPTNEKHCTRAPCGKRCRANCRDTLLSPRTRVVMFRRANTEKDLIHWGGSWNGIIKSDWVLILLVYTALTRVYL